MLYICVYIYIYIYIWFIDKATGRSRLLPARPALAVPGAVRASFRVFARARQAESIRSVFLVSAESFFVSLHGSAFPSQLVAAARVF